MPESEYKREIEYSVRRSDRARRVRVTVDHARGVEVVLPAARRPSARRPRRSGSCAPWIERRPGRACEPAPEQAVAARGDAAPYLGELLHGARRARAAPGSTAAAPSCSCPGERAAQEALERWYRRAARAEIAPRLEHACALAGLSYSKLTIRGQRTRWASCSRSGAMSFNWRLLLAPEAVLDYVVWHEVCHLEVMDHSPRFWSLLASRCPDYRQYKAWLRRHGATLVL